MFSLAVQGKLYHFTIVLFRSLLDMIYQLTMVEKFNLHHLDGMNAG